MHDECLSVWVRIWRSCQQLSHRHPRDTADALTVAEPVPLPSPILLGTDSNGEGDASAIATGTFVQVPPIHLRHPNPLEPVFDFESVGPGLGAERALVLLSQARLRSTSPVQAELPLLPPPLPVDANDTERDCPADAPAERPVSVRTSHATTNFALPARLAVIAKLNVASARKPRPRAYHLANGKAVPVAAKARPVRAAHPLRLQALKPTTRVIAQKQMPHAAAVVIDLDVVRKAVQSSPAARHAA